MRNTGNHYDALPTEMRPLKHWVCLSIETRDGKRTKVPYQPNGRKAMSNNPGTWSTYDQVLAAAGRFDGIGFMFGAGEVSSGFAGVDLDHCVENGVIAEWAQIVIDSFASYAEISFSGTGVHIIVKGRVEEGRKHGDFEVYSSKRYFTMSGHVAPGGVPTIESRQEELSAFVERVFPKRQKPEDAPKRAASAPSSLSDADLLAKAQGAKNGGAFSALWRGDVSGHQSDASRADLALCTHLAFWFGNDAGAIDRTFRLSGLYREDKWGIRADYRERTISRAIACTSETYSPPGFDAAKGFGKSRSESPQDGTQEAVGGNADTETPEPLPGIMPMVARKLAGLPCEVLSMGVRVDDGATEKAYREIVGRLLKVRDVTECPLHLSIGDVYNSLPAKYGTRRLWVQRYGQGLQMQFRRWGHVAGQWPQEMRRPGIPWSFYEAGARLPEAEKKIMIAKHDEGQRPTVGEVRALPSGTPKAKNLPRDLKSAFVALLENKGEEFVKDLLIMASSGALDEFLAGDKTDEKADGKTTAQGTEKNADFDDFPSKHCSDSEQCWPDFPDDFPPEYGDADAPDSYARTTPPENIPGDETDALPLRSASGEHKHAGGRQGVAERSPSECVNTGERFKPAAKAPECFPNVFPFQSPVSECLRERSWPRAWERWMRFSGVSNGGAIPDEVGRQIAALRPLWDARNAGDVRGEQSAKGTGCAGSTPAKNDGEN